MNKYFGKLIFCMYCSIFTYTLLFPCLSLHLQYLHVLLFGDRHILPILTALFYFKNVLSESLARVAHDAYTDPIFKELRCLKFDAIYLSQLGMFKYSNKLLPQTFDNIFLRINTRRVENISTYMYN